MRGHTLLAATVGLALAGAGVVRPCAAQEKPLRPGPTVDDARKAATGVSGDPSFPLIHEWQREGYNFWAELKAALGQGAYPDAAQLIFEASAAVDRGLMPDLHDPTLLVPHGTLIATVLQDHPQIREAMRERYGKLAGLRMTAAEENGDAAALETLAAQFRGTAIGAEAHRRLGDRLLSAGQFYRAAGHYRQAVLWAEEEERPAIAARLRLAVAASGAPVGGRAEAEVQVGSSRLGAAEFERLVKGLADRHADGAVAGGMAAAEIPPAPAAGRYEIRQRAEGMEEGNAPTRRPPPPAKERFDWRPGHFAMLPFGELCLASDGRRVAALKLSTGDEVWVDDFGEKSSARSTAWQDVVFRPLAVPGRMFVRRWKERDPELCCLDLLNGEVVWGSGTGRAVVSDPLWDAAGVVALSLTLEEPPTRKKIARPTWQDRRPLRAGSVLAWELHWTAFDPSSGEAVLSRRLARLQVRERSLPVCRAAADGEWIVAGVPGALVCMDRAGNLRWLRRHPAPDAASAAPAWGAPVLGDGRVFVVGPSGNAIQAVDLELGRMHWQCALPGLGQLVGVADQRLVAQTASGLVAVDVGSGQVAWRSGANPPRHAVMCGGPGGLAFAWCNEDHSDPRGPALVWLDMKTGRIAAEQPIDRPLIRGQPPKGLALTSLMLAEGRLFAGFRSPFSSRKLFGLLEFVPLDPRGARGPRANENHESHESHESRQ